MISFVLRRASPLRSSRGALAARRRGPRRAWPAKPIHLVSPFNPGGAIDVLNRIIAEKLALRLGQPVIVEAIPGANTIKGADVVAKRRADGYTFMITTMSTHVNNTVLFAKLPFDPVKDFAPITQVSLGSVLLIAPGNAPYSDLKGFVAWAKAQKRPISYGSWGVGSSANVYGEILAKDYGVSLTHVPYKGELPAITDVIGGSLDVTFASPVGAKPQVQAGKLKALGMTGPAALGRDARRADLRRAGPARASSCRSGSPRTRRPERRGRSSSACSRRSPPSSACPTCCRR